MFLAYVDDSGDPVFAEGASITYTLGCVLVLDTAWPRVFDDLIGFRRFLKTTFGIPVRAELKANDIIRNKGAFLRLGLNEATRRRVYRLSLRAQEGLGTKTFAIVIDKAALAKRDPGLDPRAIAWEYLLQRLERLSSKSSNAPILVLHDEGEALTIRKLARRARRIGTAGSHFGTGSLTVPARYLIDDPVPRDSAHSFFVQLADLNAYAAFRRLYPPPPRVVQIVSQDTWDRIGTGRFWPANKLKGGVPGIVHWPS